MINYKHLYYFWVVAKEGSITKASDSLHLTPQTISGQLSQLEERLDIALFTKVGRNLKLTETGKLVMQYADEIFALGDELEEMLRTVPEDQPMEFNVGVLDVVPKSIAYQLLSPALDVNDSVRIVCREGSMEELLLDLAVHKLDLVLADTPIPKSINVKGFNHHLGECGISFFAAKPLAKKVSKQFPESLNGAPMLIPGKIASIYDQIQNWFTNNNIQPKIIGEFDDTALMKAFGRGGKGIFTAPTPIAKEVEHEYNVLEVGRTDQIVEQFYAITVERKIVHPAVIAITESAKRILF